MKALNLCLGLNECNERQAKASRSMELGAQNGRHFNSVGFFSFPYLGVKKQIQTADPYLMERWWDFVWVFFPERRICGEQKIGNFKAKFAINT